MKITLRPLPFAIAAMALLVSVKTVNLVEAIDLGSPARAGEQHAAAPAAAKPAADRPRAPEPTQAAAAPPAEPPISDAERATLQDLRARRKELDARAAALDEREAILAAAEQRLSDRVKELSALQTKLEGLDKARHERDEANWRGLVKTYEAMRPRDAATIFNDLDGPVLLQVLDRMKEAKAAPILAAMAPERARAVTAQLAQYRAEVSAAPRLDQPAGAQKP